MTLIIKYLNINMDFFFPHSVSCQAFPSGVSDENVQLLGSVSRVASLDDIFKWNITKIDTLAALMKADDGLWEAAKVCVQYHFTKNIELSF